MTTTIATMVLTLQVTGTHNDVTLTKAEFNNQSRHAQFAMPLMRFSGIMAQLASFGVRQVEVDLTNATDEAEKVERYRQAAQDKLNELYEGWSVENTTVLVNSEWDETGWKVPGSGGTSVHHAFLLSYGGAADLNYGSTRPTLDEQDTTCLCAIALLQH